MFRLDFIFNLKEGVLQLIQQSAGKVVKSYEGGRAHMWRMQVCEQVNSNINSLKPFTTVKPV